MIISKVRKFAKAGETFIYVDPRSRHVRGIESIAHPSFIKYVHEVKVKEIPKSFGQVLITFVDKSTGGDLLIDPDALVAIKSEFDPIKERIAADVANSKRLSEEAAKEYQRLNEEFKKKAEALDQRMKARGIIGWASAHGHQIDTNIFVEEVERIVKLLEDNNLVLPPK